MEELASVASPQECDFEAEVHLSPSHQGPPARHGTCTEELSAHLECACEVASNILSRKRA